MRRQRTHPHTRFPSPHGAAFAHPPSEKGSRYTNMTCTWAPRSAMPQSSCAGCSRSRDGGWAAVGWRACAAPAGKQCTPRTLKSSCALQCAAAPASAASCAARGPGASAAAPPAPPGPPPAPPPAAARGSRPCGASTHTGQGRAGAGARRGDGWVRVHPAPAGGPARLRRVLPRPGLTRAAAGRLPPPPAAPTGRGSRCQTPHLRAGRQRWVARARVCARQLRSSLPTLPGPRSQACSLARQPCAPLPAAPTRGVDLQVQVAVPRGGHGQLSGHALGLVGQGLEEGSGEAGDDGHAGLITLCHFHPPRAPTSPAHSHPPHTLPPHLYAQHLVLQVQVEGGQAGDVLEPPQLPHLALRVRLAAPRGVRRAGGGWRVRAAQAVWCRQRRQVGGRQGGGP